MTALLTIGSYELLDKIAEGGMGTIYRGRHRSSGQVVAVKVMPASMAGNPVLLKRFEQEFRAASRLNHPNIVRALDYNDTASTPYLVMEYVDGESLGQKIDRDGRFSEQDAIRIVAQVAQGLHRAHKLNLIHRDVKPDNILLTRDGVAKLADLGLVKETENDLNLTRTGRGLGTPHFMAPEQFRNAKNADARCDIYSLAATLYMMVTGELPFKSNGPLDAWMKKVQNDLPSARSVVPTLSERIDWAIMRAMNADPELRPASCREFVEDLVGHSTRRLPTVDSASAPTEHWYLVYRDEEGVPHTVKGGINAIRRSLREGLLGDASNILASHVKTGPFEPLRKFPEFRDLVIRLDGAAGSAQVPVSSKADTPTTPQARVPTLPPPTPSGHVPTPAGAPQAPHIDLRGEAAPSGGDVLEWIKVCFFLAVATASGALIAYLFLR